MAALKNCGWLNSWFSDVVRDLAGERSGLERVRQVFDPGERADFVEAFGCSNAVNSSRAQILIQIREVADGARRDGVEHFAAKRAQSIIDVLHARGAVALVVAAWSRLR